MTVSTTSNLSQLAELMGNNYVERDARGFAEFLLDQGITDTNQTSDTQWADLLSQWESDQAA